MAELNVAQRLHALSGNVASQPYIARRGILATMKKFLAHQDVEVQVVAAQTLRLLASHPDNPEYMAKEEGLVAALLEAYDGTDNAELKKELEGVMTHLKSASTSDESTLPSTNSSTPKGVRKAYPAVPEQHKKQVAPRTKANDRAVRSQRRHVLLKAESICPSNVDDLERLLQYIRGVISYSIDTQNKTLNLFLTTPKHILLKHLADVGFQCEVLEETVAKASGQASGSSPSYLSSGEPHESDYKKSLVLTGNGEASNVGGSSLAARLKEQHKARNKASEEERNSVSGFFSGLARNLLS